jgi:hypothetical protein
MVRALDEVVWRDVGVALAGSIPLVGPDLGCVSVMARVSMR